MEKIYRLSINNFLTVEKMTFDLNGVKGFVGKNAQGKSNILLALDQLLHGNNDINLIKDGKDRYEIRLDEIVDGEVINRVQRVQTQTSNTITGKLNNGTPKQYISSLIDDIAVNPIRIIEEDPVKYLKAHIVAPLQDGDILNHEYKEIEFDKNRNVFNECKRHQDYFDKVRVETYGKLRHAKELCSELQKTLPDKKLIPEVNKDEYIKQLSEINNELGKAEKTQERINNIDNNIKDRKDNLDKLRTKYTDAKAESSQAVFDYEKKSAESINTLKSEITRLESELQTAKDNLAKATEEQPKEIERINKFYEEKLASITKEADIEKKEVATLEQEKEAIGTLDTKELELKKQNIENEIKQADNWLLAKDGYKKLEQHEKNVEAIQKVYDDLDALFKHYAYELPKKLITRCKLPVEGLEFKDDELYVNGRQYKRLSEGERLIVAGKLAVELAKRKNQIAVCLDGIEILDPTNRKALIEYMQKADIAVLYTRQGDPEYDHEIEIKNGQPASGGLFDEKQN